MATLTYNATVGAKRTVSVTAGAGGALTGSVAVLINNTVTDKKEIVKALNGIIRRFDRDCNKNSKVDTIATSGTTLE
jgi:hypothetical protein